MRISVNWLRDFVNVDASAQEIADRLSVSGLEVEHLEQWESVPGGLNGFVIGQVAECAKHPNADKLSVTKVDIGTGELQPIVCGAPNVAAGQKVIVALPGTEVTVPGKGTFTIGEAKIRGEISRGMICAEDECGLGSSHDGILVLPADATVGLPAADYFNVTSDEVLEIGLTANRGDAASHLGTARDVAALFEAAVKMPEVPARPLATGRFNIHCEAAQCTHYVGLELNEVKAVPSPDWMQNRLKAIGIEPKNVLVDATNYTLHALGQPIHAFDADKLRGEKIVVRLATAGEKFTTLDKVERECKGGELVIADAEGIVAFAGVMGGLGSAVTENTTRILIESAHFNPSLVRKTARAHGLNTDASFRFERSTDPAICRTAALYTADTILQFAGGNITGINHCIAEEFTPRSISLNLQKLQNFAGADIPEKTAIDILKNLGFTAGHVQNGTAEITIPSWRNDVEQEVDLMEEIMRIYGFDHIPMSGKMQISMGTFEGFAKRKVVNRVSQNLQAIGFYEIVNNSLTAPSRYSETDSAKLVQLTNPLSSDMAAMRGTLLHGMLQAAAYNQNRRMADIRFFESGRVYTRQGNGFEETETFALLIGGNRTAESWELKQEKLGFYDLKEAARAVNIAAGSLCSADDWQLSAVSREELKKFELDGEFWYAEITWAKLLNTRKPEGFRITEPARFPTMRRDLSLVVNKACKYADLEKVVANIKSPLIRETGVFDVFEGKPLEEGKKAIALSFVLGRDDRTLMDEEADTLMQELMRNFEKQTGAVIRK